LALSLVSILFALEKQLGVYGQRMRSSSSVIPIMTCSVLYRVLDLRLVRVFCPKSAMIGLASVMSPNRCSAWRARHR
jgi:hypothetical protein